MSSVVLIKYIIDVIKLNTLQRLPINKHLQLKQNVSAWQVSLHCSFRNMANTERTSVELSKLSFMCTNLYKFTNLNKPVMRGHLP